MISERENDRPDRDRSGRPHGAENPVKLEAFLQPVRMLSTDREHYRMVAGGCLSFPSTLPHRWLNLGPDSAELLWVNTPPMF